MKTKCDMIPVRIPDWKRKDNVMKDIIDSSATDG